MTTVGRGALFDIDLVIAQGTDIELVWRWKTGPDGAEQPVDLTGWTARGQVRQNRRGDLWLTLNSGDEIDLAADGTITITIPHAVTETDAWNDRSKGVWDLELTRPDGRRERFAAGSVTVSHEVTRDG